MSDHDGLFLTFSVSKILLCSFLSLSLELTIFCRYLINTSKIVMLSFDSAFMKERLDKCVYCGYVFFTGAGKIPANQLFLYAHP